MYKHHVFITIATNKGERERERMGKEEEIEKVREKELLKRRRWRKRERMGKEEEMEKLSERKRGNT